MAAVDGVDFSGVTAPYVHLIIFVTRGLFYFGAENVQGRKGTSRLKTCKAIGHPPPRLLPQFPWLCCMVYRRYIEFQYNYRSHEFWIKI